MLSLMPTRLGRLSGGTLQRKAIRWKSESAKGVATTGTKQPSGVSWPGRSASSRGGKDKAQLCPKEWQRTSLAEAETWLVQQETLQGSGAHAQRTCVEVERRSQHPG